MSVKALGDGRLGFLPVLYFLPLHDLSHDVLACTGAMQNSANNAGILRPFFQYRILEAVNKNSYIAKRPGSQSF